MLRQEPELVPAITAMPCSLPTRMGPEPESLGGGCHEVRKEGANFGEIDGPIAAAIQLVCLRDEPLVVPPKPECEASRKLRIGMHIHQSKDGQGTPEPPLSRERLFELY